MTAEKLRPSKPLGIDGVVPRLAVGPMSRLAVRAAHQVAVESNTQLMLIASRRQVDRAELGGGYVEKWTSSDFADFVRNEDRGGHLLLCRDHGGPWQKPGSGTLTAAEEMEESFQTFVADIDAGFRFLHIDTSLENGVGVPVEVAIGRLLTLYGRCDEYAKTVGADVQYEIGFEVQGVAVNDPTEFEAALATVFENLSRAGLPTPTFTVAQTGTKVLGDRNIGDLVDPRSRAAVLNGIRAVAVVCRRWGTGLKAHNVDYLSASDVAALFASGVNAINVAPEFGVRESRMLNSLFEMYAPRLAEAFLQIALDAGNWKQWEDPSQDLRPKELALLGAHYVFSDERVVQMRSELNHAVIKARGVSADSLIQEGLVKSIQLYSQAASQETSEMEAVAK